MTTRARKIGELMGTPYFLAKATPEYGNALVEVVERAIRERRSPTSA